MCERSEKLANTGFLEAEVVWHWMKRLSFVAFNTKFFKSLNKSLGKSPFSNFFFFFGFFFLFSPCNKFSYSKEKGGKGGGGGNNDYV